MNLIDMKPILDRLIQARKNAGLTDIQAGRLIGDGMNLFLHGTEAGILPLRVDAMLRLCEIYDVDVIYILTGENPHFNEHAAMDLLSNPNIADEDKERVLEMLKSARHTDGD